MITQITKHDYSDLKLSFVAMTTFNLCNLNLIGVIKIFSKYL
jgi:hypothetical protein